MLERQLRKLGLGNAETPTAEQWRAFLERVDRAYTEADQDRYTLERALDLSSAEMRKRFTELRNAQGQLVEASRKAGMADVATSVLHNIGNVLNSINVSANFLGEAVKQSARTGLTKTLALLGAQPEPGAFIDHDPRGKKVVPYLAAVDKSLGEERETMLREIESLTKHLEHIKAIVSEQLAAARGHQRARVTEQFAMRELLDDAIAVSEVGRDPSIRLVREIDAIVLDSDRHKLTQIIVNLLRNARDAIAAAGAPGVLTVRARRAGDGRVSIEVQDTGIGIPKDAMSRIFNHGFTTKSNGHGFGLHHSACAAMELGGTLTATSDGAFRGATFTVTLPRSRSTSGPMAARSSAPVRAVEET